jgi:hypothetical protein
LAFENAAAKGLITLIAARGVPLDGAHHASSRIVGDHKADVFWLTRCFPGQDCNVAGDRLSGGNEA